MAGDVRSNQSGGSRTGDIRGEGHRADPSAVAVRTPAGGAHPCVIVGFGIEAAGKGERVAGGIGHKALVDVVGRILIGFGEV